MQDESTELRFIFRSAHSVLYYPLENIVPEIPLHIRCNKPHLRSCTTRNIAHRHGLEANIALGFTWCYIVPANQITCS